MVAGQVVEGARTVYFLVALLVVMSLPVMVAIGDVAVMCALVSSFTCVNCYSFREHLQSYGFKSSLTDIPLVSIIRSLIIIYVYTMCDGLMLSHGPYLRTVIFCSINSTILLSTKACPVTVNFEIETSAILSRQMLHLKARRKLLFHGVEPEAVDSCKIAFSGFQRVPRSPTPSSWKTSEVTLK
ncbi:Hypothetical predicted protein [Olea europaea subsp. europaea]|uniref:Uncharacterized protein n=1 Tax=Olea europaea subsp. europaea TaxID=158383 RepID=A0A8S0SXJ7_OLEEU|nr:Hypothetical predicted protein [Olea europaea subsp. europaea]